MPPGALERGEQRAVRQRDEAAEFALKRRSRQRVNVKCEPARVDGLPGVAELHRVRRHHRLQIANRSVWVERLGHRSHHEISRPDTRNVNADAALAMVEMNPPGSNAWPTSSGQV